MSKSYSYYFPPSPGPVFKISMVLQLLWQQKVETGVITTRALGSLLCAMPLEKVTRRSYNIWSSALRSLSPGRKKKKKQMQGKKACPRLPEEAGTEARPLSYQELQARKIPQSRQAEHKRETHHREEMFSHKSNFLQFVFQQQIRFQFLMPLFKSDPLPFD